MFLANKQDDENALDEIDLHEKLNLEDMVNKYHCPTLVECCSATYTGKNTKMDPGISKGFIWLMNIIDKNYISLDNRVSTDLKQQSLNDEKMRHEIFKRIHEAKELEESNDENVIELYSEYAKKFKSHSNKVENVSGALSSISDSFEEEFPHVYYGSAHIKNIQRPSSARDFVRNQLQLNCNGIVLSKNNRVPTNIEGLKLPNSAGVRSKTCVIPKRILKSAGDIKTSPHLPNMVFPKEKSNNLKCGDMQITNTNSHFLPLDISPMVYIQNMRSRAESEEDNVISYSNHTSTGI